MSNTVSPYETNQIIPASPDQPTLTTDVTADVLSRLRDIHLPALSHHWLPTGQILVMLGLFMLLAMAAYLLRRYYRNTRTRRYALQELEMMQSRFHEHKEKQRFLMELNMLLRRMAMIHNAREKVAPLSGSAWLEFLDRSGRTCHFSQGVGRALLHSYQPEPDFFDEQELIEVVQAWIRHQL